MYQNVLSPVISANYNHAYVSIQSVLHHALSLNIEIPLIKSSAHLNMMFDNTHELKTTKAKQIMEQTSKDIYPRI